MQHIKADNTDYKTLQNLARAQLDIFGAKDVEVAHNADKSILWVNVNGVCVLRICRIESAGLHVPRTL